MGCDSWPDCYAQLNWEAEKKGITVLTEDGRDMAHYGARIAHRYIASVLGLFIVVIVVVALRQGKARATGISVPMAIFALTVFLSLLGYYTPTRSNPLITMGNLLGGMGLLGLLWWQMQRYAQETHPIPGCAGFKPLAIGALFLLLLQIVLGGWSSANYASANCPGLLECQGQLVSGAQMADAFNPFREISVDRESRVVRDDALGLMSMAHRMLALLTAAYLAWLMRKLKSQAELRGTVLTLSVFSVGQIILGVSMIWLDLPLLLLTLHNALAACLLLASINLLHRLSPAAGSPPPG